MHKNAFMVVIDPTTEQQPAFERALQSAKMSSRKLHLVACVFFDKDNIDSKLRGDMHKQALINTYQNWLDGYKAIAAEQGIETTTELLWHAAWGEAVLDATRRGHYHMVFKTSSVHKQAERSDSTADWRLLRECPCPVLLLHNKSSWVKRRVLAAINLATQDEAHQRLNEKVMAMANSFKVEYAADVHFVNSVPREVAPHNSGLDNEDDLLFYVLPSDFADTPSHAPTVTEELLLKHCHTDKAHVHIEAGEPVDAILAVAEQFDVDLIIVGTIGRTGIKGRIIGNTAERLLDRARCDLLTLT